LIAALWQAPATSALWQATVQVLQDRRFSKRPYRAAAQVIGMQIVAGFRTANFVCLRRFGKLRLPGFAGFEDADSCGADAHGF